jgi:hypothetical protein
LPTRVAQRFSRLASFILIFLIFYFSNLINCFSYFFTKIIHLSIDGIFKVVVQMLDEEAFAETNQ